MITRALHYTYLSHLFTTHSFVYYFHTINIRTLTLLTSVPVFNNNILQIKYKYYSLLILNNINIITYL